MRGRSAVGGRDHDGECASETANAVGVLVPFGAGVRGAARAAYDTPWLLECRAEPDGPGPGCSDCGLGIRRMEFPQARTDKLAV